MNHLTFEPSVQKTDVFGLTSQWLEKQGFRVIKKDDSRPWGGFFVIDENQTADFAATFFPEIKLSDIQITQKLSPKILVVGPDKRLSWQYHFRRAEIWRVVTGTVAVKTSPTDQEGEIQAHTPGSLIVLQQGERHRLIGLTEWGIIAEIWQHTDANNPSDEDDIVRVQDDFGR